jgi:heme/copper-type cytochrome/quinol oxidase subunit 2
LDKFFDRSGKKLIFILVFLATPSINAFKDIKQSDTWSFNNLLTGGENVVQNDFEDFMWDSSRDDLSNQNYDKKTLHLPTVQQVWQWLFRFSKKKTTTATTTITERTTTESYPISIGKTRRPSKYKRTRKDITQHLIYLKYFLQIHVKLQLKNTLYFSYNRNRIKINSEL